MQVFLNRLSNSLCLGCFAPSKFKMLQDWVGSMLSLVIAEEQLGVMDGFSNSVSCISPLVRMSDGVSLCIQMVVCGVRVAARCWSKVKCMQQ